MERPATSDPAGSTTGPVRLSLPASPRYLAAARVVAASLGAESGLSVDDLEDLRLGVNELVSVLVESGDAGVWRVIIEYDEEAVGLASMREAHALVQRCLAGEQPDCADLIERLRALHRGARLGPSRRDDEAGR